MHYARARPHSYPDLCFPETSWFVICAERRISSILIIPLPFAQGTSIMFALNKSSLDMLKSLNYYSYLYAQIILFVSILQWNPETSIGHLKSAKRQAVD